MCSETSTPPRLSFSHNLSEFQLQKDVTCIETLLLDSNSDFEFNTSNILEFESSSADELFSNGKILPKHTPFVKSNHTKFPPRPSASNVDKMKKESNPRWILAQSGTETVRELLNVSTNNEKKHHSKSFWGFSRSKSLNCDTKKNLSFSLPPLYRSNSTGSAKKMSSNKQTSSATTKSSSWSNINLYPMQKSNSGKSYGGSYGNGHWISPVLNVPTPCVSKGSANFFRFGSFLSIGKVKKNKK
ncbi:hypothetical protein MtrunA17_Chr6g0484211 [Medicago truncatula]|uniref:Uncharacterized protein n=1 Tax=Medicago truncatula TaxID=3880 RepID=G7KN00_MEDTR|nr:uncharacterized protein LOC11427433 [Medicago truncatula]AES76659.1 hypothetical protein MTR_6g083930 [Medicago truncatula]RHN52781.1 hypothetical protein MtrunA17_Chr6g0484211 [Medicago truncatula]